MKTAFAGIDRIVDGRWLCGLRQPTAKPLTREEFEELWEKAMQPQPPRPVIFPPCPKCGAPVLKLDGECFEVTGDPHECEAGA